jgi:acetolactate synthase-1/3 small subunit
VVTVGDEKMINQIATQLSKLLLVISVDILTDEDSIQRELVLIKVKAETRGQRDDVLQIINVFRASVLDMGRESMTVAVLGNAEKTKALLNLLEDFGILEVVRSGMIALERGRNTIYDRNKIKEEYNYGKNVL